MCDVSVANFLVICVFFSFICCSNKAHSDTSIHTFDFCSHRREIRIFCIFGKIFDFNCSGTSSKFKVWFGLCALCTVQHRKTAVWRKLLPHEFRCAIIVFARNDVLNVATFLLCNAFYSIMRTFFIVWDLHIWTEPFSKHTSLPAHTCI